MQVKGIDVSSHQRSIDWWKVKKAGCQFAILRCHQQGGIDEYFRRNYKGAIEAGIPIGIYVYYYCTSVSAAEKKADEVLKELSGKKIDYPIYYDIEGDNIEALGKATIEKVAIAFLTKFEKAGYTAGIYCNNNFFNNFISDELKRRFTFWIASYPYNDHGQMEERLWPSGCAIWQYSENGRIDGIAGAVDLDVYETENPDKIQNEKDVESGFVSSGNTAMTGSFITTSSNTAIDILDIMRSWIGKNEADGSHREIVDIYNSHYPLAMNYKLSYTDSWCDATVSAAFIKAGLVELIGGTECGVERHIAIFKNKGIWIEDGSITPKEGDIICYNWDKSSQPNDGFADHIGIVESVLNGVVTIIEGNFNSRVARRKINVGWGYIRGYARPEYGVMDIRNEFSDGTGSYTPPTVPSFEKDKPATSTESGKTRRLYVGKVTADSLNVRTWAGVENSRIISWPVLSYGNLVDVMDYTQYDKNGEPWLYIRIDGRIHGFVKADYISKV